MKSGKALNKALFISERRVRLQSALYFFQGLKKVKGWKKLSGFKDRQQNFKHRLAVSGTSFYNFCLAIADPAPQAKKMTEDDWKKDFIDKINSNTDLNETITNITSLRNYIERGILSPYLPQICSNILKLREKTGLNTTELEAFLPGLLNSLEQIIRRAFTLELNIRELKGELVGSNNSERFNYYIRTFRSPSQRLDFAASYPVLTRMIGSKLNEWLNVCTELLERLSADRKDLSNLFGLSIHARLKAINQGGDTHNNGRSVFIIEFDDSTKIVYKPRSVSLESGFQEYIAYFNKYTTELNLRQLNILDRAAYGWVEYVKHKEQTTQEESNAYHYKLGYQTALVYSLCGVDVFFENLVAAGPDPIIIDLEALFHTPIDIVRNSNPSQNLQMFLNHSIAGIGILPRPSAGSTDTDVFDISVMGAKKNARAPYKVIGLENFGRSDMRIGETAGWIAETHAASSEIFSQASKNENYFRGLSDGLSSLIANKDRLCASGGLLDEIFSGAVRRLIVRDTKTYGTLQQDETHPDLLRNQIDREWLWDNLWGELKTRPNLSLFIESELAQARLGDIPYFSGHIDSRVVTGGDGIKIDLSNIHSSTPIQSAKARISDLNENTSVRQQRLAATLLGISNVPRITSPAFDPNKSYLKNALEVAEFINSRIEIMSDCSWIYTTYNPAPKANTSTAINIRPCDPYLYDGVSGIALFLHKTWELTGKLDFRNSALNLFDSVFMEIEHSENQPTSGFTGLSSVVYVANRMVSSDELFRIQCEKKLRNIVELVAALAPTDPNVDFLLGIAGTSCAMIPYVRRTLSSTGKQFLFKAMLRLLDEASALLRAESPIPGMLNLRGLSHGISGVALGLYRLGSFFNDQKSIQLAELLLIREYELVESRGWTDSHKYAGEALVGWCHGSAGIACALSEMPELCALNSNIQRYKDAAYKNTVSRGRYSSLCLCHGVLGNIFCLSQPHMDNFGDWDKSIETQLMVNGFESLDAAQSIGVGLMTGVTGGGYYLLTKASGQVDRDFLTLA